MGRVYDEVSDEFGDEQLLYCRTRRCRIVHGSISWLATTATVLFAGEKLEHEWLEFETNNAYYVAQLWKDGNITLRRFTSRSHADLDGLTNGGRDSTASVWTERSLDYKDKNKYRTVADIIKFVGQANALAYYELISHNCKHFCIEMWNSLN